MADDNEALTKIKSQKYFYRNYYRAACNVLWGTLILIMLLSVLLIYLYIQRGEPDYYATSSDGKLVKLTPLLGPNNSHLPLIQ